jgi:hypothetical protein
MGRRRSVKGEAVFPGWRSTQRWSPSGSVESEQRALADGPVVAATREGARTLGDRYWLEVERFAGGLVRVSRSAAGVELRFLPGGPRLLVLGPAELSASGGDVVCRHSIVGGLLARRPGGCLSLSQAREVELRSTISGFFPVLGRGPGRAGTLYSHVQSRIHVRISRRFFRGLIEARRP